MNEQEARTPHPQQEQLTPMQKIIQEWQTERAARANNSLRWDLQDIAIAALFTTLVIATAINAVQAVESLPK